MVKEGCSSSKRGGTIAMVFTPLWLDWKEWEHSTVRKGNSSVIRSPGIFTLHRMNRKAPYPELTLHSWMERLARARNQQLDWSNRQRGFYQM